MARRRGGVPFRGSQKRLTEWSSLADQSYVDVGSGASVLLSSVSFEDPGTIVRSRGIFSIRAQSPITGDLDIGGAFGVGLVSAEALAIGITALPKPHADADWGGWMVWRPFQYFIEFGDGTGVNMFSNDWMLEIDSKAMRKVEPNSAMVFVVESQVGVFSVAEKVRLLLKLH